MTEGYATDGAFKAALDARLEGRAAATGMAHQRLQRRVVTERLLARTAAEHPGRWVLKGGAALEVRLGDAARATKDVDLGLRMEPPEGDLAIEMLSEVLAHDLRDRFSFRLEKVTTIDEQAAGDIRRASVTCLLAGKVWGRIKVDIGIRSHELDDTEPLGLPDTLAFAGIPSPTVEAISPRHAAEKLHGMLRTFGDRENTRTRDLLDIALLVDRGLIDVPRTADAVRTVFVERGTELPDALPALPEAWREPYEASAAEHDIHPRSFTDAVAVATALWAELFSEQEPS